MKNRAIFLVLLAAASVSPAWGVSFFEVEVARNVVQDTVFNITGPVDSGSLSLAEGSAVGIYIGTERALDFNLKLNFEFGVSGGKYRIGSYTTGLGGAQAVKGEMSYYNYIFMAGLRLKYDFQITDSVSIEPYILTGLTPLYMYSPSNYLNAVLDNDLGFTDEPSYTFLQSKRLALDYWGIGFDIDFSRASVEYSGSSKLMVGVSYRQFDREVKFRSNRTTTSPSFLCMTLTVLF